MLAANVRSCNLVSRATIPPIPHPTHYRCASLTQCPSTMLLLAETDRCQQRHQSSPALPIATKKVWSTTGFASGYGFETLALFSRMLIQTPALGGRTGILRVSKNNVATPTKNQSISPSLHHRFCGRTSDSPQSPLSYTTQSHSHRRSPATGDRRSRKF